MSFSALGRAHRRTARGAVGNGCALQRHADGEAEASAFWWEQSEPVVELSA